MSCPICKKTTNSDYRPFCSKRCSDVDLGRWLTEGYAIPGSPADIEDADDTPDPETHRLH